MEKLLDNRIYIFAKKEDNEKALHLKHMLIESNFERILDIRILNPETDSVMQLAYEVQAYPTIIVLDKENKEVNRYYSDSFEILKILVRDRSIKMEKGEE